MSTGGLANFAVAGLTLGALIGLARLFTNPSRFFMPAAFVALTIHALCWVCRRAGINLPVSALIAATATTLCTAWVIFGATTTYGIPGHATAHAARVALSNAADVYRTIAAPAPVLPGFTLAASVGAATAAFLADWAAFRMRATVEACLPSFSLFVLSAALAQGQAEVLAGAVWLGALLLFLLFRQAAVDSAPATWFAGGNRRGTRAVIVAGAAVGACAVAAAAIVGPQLPGASIHPLINWRHRNATAGNRTIGTSPLVDITARLQSLSHQEVFTVSSPRPVYWRLTSLDRFTGTGWALDSQYVGVNGRLGDGSSVDVGQFTQLRAQFRITALSSIWLPAPYRPTHITGVGGISYSADSGSLITDKATSNGLKYVVDAAVPASGPASLSAAPAADPSDPTVAHYLELPALPSQIQQIALQVTQRATTPYARARALEDWLRSPPFRYDLNVRADDSKDALTNFLTVTKAGFCQQFAASFAVLARAIGLPTRVAVGFTEGDLTADGLYHVTDAQAHAWPEVYFPGVGWAAFEPTPGRGSPDPTSQLVTGAPPAQQSDAGAGSSATLPTTAASPGATAAPLPGQGAIRATPTTAPKVAAHANAHGRSWLDLFLLLGLLALIPFGWVALLAGIGAAIWGRRTRQARTPNEVVNLAWRQATEALTDVGTAPRASETPAEFARRAGRGSTMADDGVDALGELALAVEVADYAPTGADPQAVAETRRATARVRAGIRARQDWWRRAAAHLDPRPAIRLLASELQSGLGRKGRRD